jgi:hypothetical protein
MSLLLVIGQFLLWAVLQLLTTFAFAIPAGIGLAAGFHLFKKWKNKSYLKELEAEQLAGAAATS